MSRTVVWLPLFFLCKNSKTSYFNCAPRNLPVFIYRYMFHGCWRSRTFMQSDTILQCLHWFWLHFHKWSKQLWLDVCFLTHFCVLARCSFYPRVNKSIQKCCIITLRGVFVQGIQALDTLPLYMYVLWTLDAICHDPYKTITSLSSFNNLVYYCNTNDCINHVKNIISEWIKPMVHQR